MSRSEVGCAQEMASVITNGLSGSHLSFLLFSELLHPKAASPLYLQAVCCNYLCDNQRNKEKPCLVVLSWEGGHFPQSTTLLERLLLLFPWQELGDTWD